MIANKLLIYVMIIIMLSSISFAVSEEEALSIVYKIITNGQEMDNLDELVPYAKDVVIALLANDSWNPNSIGKITGLPLEQSVSQGFAIIANSSYKNVTCYNNYQCGSPYYNRFCDSVNNTCSESKAPACINPGKSYSYCLSNYTKTCTACQYGCTAGSCTAMPGLNCVDTEYGKSAFTNGTVTSSKGTFSDTCSGNVVIDYYCGLDDVLSINTSCTMGCAYGKCIIDCIDSDGGDKPTIKGTVNSTFGSFVDICTSTTRLSEGMCNGGSSQVIEHNNCTNCIDGRADSCSG